MRFTIRDLLWLTVVVGLGVAWWVDRSRLAREVERLHSHTLTLEPGISLRDGVRFTMTADSPALPSD
jgi:hypothetical protein